MKNTSAPSDAVLVGRAIGGDPHAFASIIARYKAPLFRLVRRYVRTDDDAYDVLQQTYVSAWMSLSGYDTSRPLRTWLQTIAINKCRDHARKLKVRQLFFGVGLTPEAYHVIDASPNAEDNLFRDARKRALATAIAELPHQLKEPLLLTVFGECSQAEASRQLGVSVKAIETRLARARRKLAEVLEQSSLGRNDYDA